MAENRCNGRSQNSNVCIDCNQILDSCRDKDCFSDVRVYLTEKGQQIIDSNCNVRIKDTEVLWTYLGLEPVQFNRGFYQADVRFFTRIVFETCTQSGRTQEFDGICVCDKRVILFGSEGNVRIFKSEPGADCFCPSYPNFDSQSTNAPSVVCEVVDPIALSMQIKEKCCDACTCDIPESLLGYLDGRLADEGNSQRRLYVTLGFFSVIRLERPGQFIVSAAEYCVPDKVCCDVSSDDPCSAFERMSFPTNEFCPLSASELNN